MLTNTETILCLHRLLYILLTSLTLSTLQCCPTSRRYSVYSVFLFKFLFTYIDDIALLIDIESTSFLHLTSSFLFTYIVDIAQVTDIESTLCQNPTPSFLLTSSTLQSWSTPSRHRFYILPLLICLPRRHCNVVKHRVDIVLWSTTNQDHIYIVLTYFISCTLSISQCWPSSSRHCDLHFANGDKWCRVNVNPDKDDLFEHNLKYMICSCLKLI